MNLTRAIGLLPPLLPLLLALAGCSSPEPQTPGASSSATTAAATSTPQPPKTSESGKPKGEDVPPIGQAKMLDDGTIVLDLFRPAMVQKKYAPSDPDYASVLAHIDSTGAPLEKGGATKVVAPWPDDIDDAQVATVVKDYVKSKRGWPDDAWKHEITGTDGDGNVVVTVTFKADLSGKANEGGKSFQLRLAPKTYAFVRELKFQ